MNGDEFSDYAFFNKYDNDRISNILSILDKIRISLPQGLSLRQCEELARNNLTDIGKISSDRHGNVTELFKKYACSNKNYTVIFKLPVSMEYEHMANIIDIEYNINEVMSFSFVKQEKSIIETSSRNMLSKILMQGSTAEEKYEAIPIISYQLDSVTSKSFISKLEMMRSNIEIALSLSVITGLLDFDQFYENSSDLKVEFYDTKNKVKNILLENIEFIIFSHDLRDFCKKLKLQSSQVINNAQGSKLDVQDWVVKNIESYKKIMNVINNINIPSCDSTKQLLNKLRLSIRWFLRLKLSRNYDRAIHINTILEILYGGDKESGKTKNMRHGIADKIASNYKEYRCLST